MPEGLSGDQPRICACSGCDEVVVQSEPDNTRLYHSAECRRKARRLRHESGAAGTADLPTAAAARSRPATEPELAAELAAAEPAGPAKLVIPAEFGATAKPTATEYAVPADPAASESPDSAEPPGSAEAPANATEHAAISAPEDQGGPDAADAEFWKPDDGEADGFWGVGKDSPRKGARSPGRHRSPAIHQSSAGQRSRLKRSHAAAIALTLAAGAAGFGLIFSQPGAHHPLASDAQLHPPGAGGTQPASSSSSPPAGHARHAAGGTSQAPRPPASSPSPPPASSSPAPSPTPSRSSSRPSPKPTPRVPSGLISFENGADGWKPMFGSIHSSQSAQVAYSGSHSLWITTRSAYSAVGVENSSISHLRPGDTVTFHIWSDGQGGGRVGVFAETLNQPEDIAETVPLPTHPGWFTVTWVVPSVSHVDVIGIQVGRHGSGKFTLAIDALSWTGS